MMMFHVTGQKRFFTESVTSLEKVSKILRPDLALRLGPDPDLAQQQGKWWYRTPSTIMYELHCTWTQF